MKKLNRKIFAGLFGVAIGVSSLSLAAPETTFSLGSVPEGYGIARQVRYSFSIQNKKDTTCNVAEFWVYAPVKQISTQCCRYIETSHPAELIEDELGNQVLHFKLTNLAPYSVTLIRIKADLMLAEDPQSLPCDNREQFLQPSKKIESTHSEITKTARRFRAKSASQKAKQIHAWTVGHVKDAGYIRDNRGALYALQQGKGDCTESAQLFTALARASGIPAKVYGGYICNTNAKLFPQEYHNWSEFLDGDKWCLADPNRQQFKKGQMDYIAMHILTESKTGNPMGSFTRFRIQGNGLKARMLD